MEKSNFKRAHDFGKWLRIVAIMVFLIFVTGCVSKLDTIENNETPAATTAITITAVPTAISTTQLPNPASKNCVEQGYNITIRTNPDGSQTGYCVFPNKMECEEWAYFRGDCKNE